ncbi:sulfotransferase [Phaeobacter sp. HF9A]|uniref:sulfotransferase n=1 Tax=Phaeobacter sp. HF9A TaxID=2721561 RepID=UPI001430DB81|nr:sulfotransferase [Phaeobacter sp. HF9A]NIZ14209.1 sulfotransferase [Phaeobacter sp. HF9A]
MSVQVINLGLPKSGTTTLHHALKAAGYRVADHRIKTADAEDKERCFVGTLMYDGLYRHGDPLALLRDYDALAEVSFIHGGQSIWPQGDHAMLLALRRLHPKLRFVATRRDTEELADSIMRWNNLGTGRLPRAQVPGMPKGYGHGIDEQMIWIDGHYEALAHWFRDDPLYLELDVAAPDAQQRLADFLGRPMPWWGRANVNKGGDTARKNRKAPD